MRRPDEYQSRFLSLHKRLTNAVAWQWLAEGLGSNMLVGSGSGLLEVINELERRYDVIYDEIVSLFENFLEEDKKEPKLLEDPEREQAVTQILCKGSDLLSGLQEETVNRVRDLAALAEKFGPIRIPFDSSLGGKILAYEHSLFREWVSKALNTHSYLDFDPLVAKDEGSIGKAVSFLASRKEDVFVQEDDPFFNLSNENLPFGHVEVPEGE